MTASPASSPGQYFDAETGLHQNYFRDYDPKTGRYIEPDPIGLAGGVNPFVYAENNPGKLVDLFGLQPDDSGGCETKTKTCVGIARYSAVGPRQANSSGALAPYGISPNVGTVAVSPSIFGLPYPEPTPGHELTKQQLRQRVQTQKILAEIAPRILITPEGLDLHAGPAPPYSVGDIGNKHIRLSRTPRFDIYRFPSLEAARQFGIQTVETTIVIPSSYQCPPGFREKRGQ